MPLEFDAERHRFTLDGQRLPSVTEVMRQAAIIDDRWYSEWARERGSAAHLACQFDDEGDLDDSTIDPVVAGYLEGWRLFRREIGAEVLYTEKPLACASMRFAGILDRVLSVGECTELVDIKTGVPGPQGGVQTAAYARLVDVNLGIRIKTRRCVQLHSDGTYTIHTYTSRDDWKVFEAALTIAHWRINGR